MNVTVYIPDDPAFTKVPTNAVHQLHRQLTLLEL
jgi:uncharacterized surface protein with fasciclin (FAS1) repeats